MAGKSAEDLEQAIAELEAKQREFGIDLGLQIKELQDRLIVPQTGSGAVATHGSGGLAAGPSPVAAGEQGVAVGRDVHGGIHIHQTASEEQKPVLRNAYLSWLIDEVRSTPLSGVDRKGVREETRRDLELAAVYTALMTKRREKTEDNAHRLTEQEEPKMLPALAVLNQDKHLALLGDPGSGKSTFVNFVALCMAGEGLGNKEANLKVLRTAVPEEDAQDEQEAPQWDHGALLPVHVVLRDFVARGLSNTDKVSGDTLWQFIIGELPDTLADFADPLRAELMEDGGLLLLDGLDEVPEAEARREQVKAVVEGFTAMFPNVRVLVTSRTYAYQNQQWTLRGFTEAALAPFSAAQINWFISRWYAYVGPLRGLSADDAKGKARLLQDTIARNPRLHELATRPLLLTLMTSLHAWRGGTLPEQREELYADAVELLLDEWESQKLKRRPDGTYEAIEPSIAEWLKVDQKAVRSALNRLAFESHRDQQSLTGTADIAEDRLLNALIDLAHNPDAKPGRLLEYLRDRAGLLEPRGVKVYAFPHRTFQEYLAACHLTDAADFYDQLTDLVKAEPNRWREVALLAGAKAVRGSAYAVWTLAEALCPKDPPENGKGEERDYWGALLAGQSLIENDSLMYIAERHQPKVARIRSWLASALGHGALSPLDRAGAGNVLGEIGDLRFHPELGYLPDEPLLGFVEVPAGPFKMGEGRNEHELSLPDFCMARYPVTVAQFRIFVEDSGYRPSDDGSLKGVPNHPVVHVTWHDALAYCGWLTDKLCEWPKTPASIAKLIKEQGWQVALPSEAEWEKAARGNDGRMYPWGETIDTNHANYDKTGIFFTSAVGCFPLGASPYGCLDVAGNVWEWTRGLWGSDRSKPEYGYPYDPTDGRENMKATDEVWRVLRGGSFLYHQHLRCAIRIGYYPVKGLGIFGFRVVLLPSL